MRKISEEDVRAIAESVKVKVDESVSERCLFKEVSPEELQKTVKFYNDHHETLEEAAKFFENYNKAMNNTKQTVLKTVVGIGTAGTVTLLIMGFTKWIGEKFPG